MITKDFRTYTMIFLRQEKSLRDHGGGLGIWRNASTSNISSAAAGCRTSPSAAAATA
jgi:hypothetical protein